MQLYFWFGNLKREMFSFILKKNCFKRFKVFCRDRKIHPIEDGGLIDDYVYPKEKRVCMYANFQQASSKIGGVTSSPLNKSSNVSVSSILSLSDHNHSDKLYRAKEIKLNELCRWWEMHNMLQEQRFPNVRPCILDNNCEEMCINNMIW
ncbi:uncharacterized protein LOC111632779 [Centruroides sculpturatus]|uniref:uncharacterized protein LOC111632779 n=1 Tax=Centruroides sculpturatus TaxID=218467 RepID=UPI000C6EF202|nr:uncharacterized protein LOC111632779 [Centruroides sculpturatus]